MDEIRKMKIGNANRMKENVFFDKLKEKYQGKYDLSNVQYKTLNDYVSLGCEKHGDFKILAKTAISKTKVGKCPLCHKEELSEISKNIERKHMTTEEFKEKGNEKYSNKYDYSKVDMNNKNGYGKICIICHELDENGIEHGEFWQNPSQHLFGKSCPKCGSRKKTTKSFILEAKKKNKGNFSYDKVDYKTIFDKITITCNECGMDFLITPHNLLKGRGCPHCDRTHGTYFKQFLEIANSVHHNFYKYQEWEGLKKVSDKVKIICPIHGEFEQTISTHFKGCGCPCCKSSKLEENIFHLLTKYGIDFEVQKKFDWLKNNHKLSLDFFIPSKNIAIECQGRQHFIPVDYFGGEESLKEIVERDKIKKELCENHGIKLLYYSNLQIEYPYKVYKEFDEIIKLLI